MSATFECVASIKRTGEIVGRCVLDYEIPTNQTGWSSSDGQLVGLDLTTAAKLMRDVTVLELRRLSDGRTAEVTITQVLTEDRVAVIFGHAPFLPPKERG